MGLQNRSVSNLKHIIIYRYYILSRQIYLNKTR